MITSLVDADSILYECGFATQKSTYKTPDEELHGTLTEARKWCDKEGLATAGIVVITEAEPVSHALKLAKNLLLRIEEQTNCDKMRVFLGGVGNFRVPLATLKPYKGNRVQPKPLHYKALWNYLTGKWGAEAVDDMEAEDMVSIECCKDPENTIIVAIDKDLNNTPGTHYNWRSDRLFEVTDVEATRNFYNQILMGDSTDNITGCPGIGKVKAEKLLRGITDEEELYDICVLEYGKRYGADAAKMLLEQAQLLWILRVDKDERWEPPLTTMKFK